jgi:xylulose-5-phosphate/fructose-6-phosphate phosphoketolase
MSSTINESFDAYVRAANYLTAAQIFLRDNFLLERPLTFDDVKPRLLGHWGSGPGVNIAYAHLSHLVKKYNQDMMFVLGPGHAFPALQANLFMEDTLSRFYPDAQRTYDGIAHICRQFSWPYGYPSHSNPGTPGVILEGGELGYSLATSYGAVLDNPDLIVSCLIGDGESETGPTAGAWHLNKLVDPRTNGVVLPIVHLNGYKISAPTVYGRMTDKELIDLFRGYGYQPRIVNADGIHEQMEESLDWAYTTIMDIKSSHRTTTPHLPMVIMRTPKGWTGPKELNGDKIEGNALSHQVVLMEAKTDANQLHMLDEWLRSYKFNELFNHEQGFGDYVQQILPDDQNKRLGMSKHAHGGDPIHKPLILPNIELYSEDASKPGTMGSSSMRRTGLYLSEVFKLNRENKNFRVMSPDETYSNKIDDIFKEAKRAWVWPIEPWDKDMAPDGRVMEMLSEHNLQGLTQGYVLTGRHAVFASYEAFIQVVVSMMDQYAKFLTHAREMPWRGDVASFNYLLTSSGWRQDHNGFSHQNPGFIDDVLRRHEGLVNVFFPADGNTTLAVMENMLSTPNMINVLNAAKTLEPRWRTPNQARQDLGLGVNIWEFASDDDPHIVLSAAGDYMTKEALAAIDLLKNDRPDIRVRFVNILSLTSCGLGGSGTCVTRPQFDQLFTTDKPTIFNFHGYPETLKSILFEYVDEGHKRFSVHGYTENGSTTTPFDMHVRNKTSRYDLLIDAYSKLAEFGMMSREDADGLITKYKNKMDENTAYIKHNGVDLPEIDAWLWNR